MTSIALEILTKAAGADAPTIDWVRERFGVTERQAFRYLQHAKNAGVELVAEKQADGRTVYRLPASAYFRPEQLSVPEAIATAVMTHALLGQPLQPDATTARTGVDKIRRALDERVAARIRHLQGRLSVRMVQAERPAAPKVFHTLVEAILGDVTVRVEYASPYIGDKAPPVGTARSARAQRARGGGTAGGDDGDGRRSSGGGDDGGSIHGGGGSGAGTRTARRIETFELEPFALVFARRSWYLIARKVASNEVRTYKLSRFTHVSTTSTVFTMPRNFTVDAHLGNSWELVRGGDALAVHLVFDPSFAGAIADTRWHRSQKLTPLPDGSLRFEATVDGVQEILWWVLGMGSHVQVVSPPELARAVRDEVARMATVKHGAAHGRAAPRKAARSAAAGRADAQRASAQRTGTRRTGTQRTPARSA